jgi:hypothetical protein
MKYPEWKETPACQGTDTEAFFPEDDKHYANVPILQKICSTCPVLNQCLEYSLHWAVTGWWGGMSEIQRRYLRRERGIIAKEVTMGKYL